MRPFLQQQPSMHDIFYTNGFVQGFAKATPARRTRVLPGHALDQGVATRLGRPIKRNVQRDDYRGIFKIARKGIQLSKTGKPKVPHNDELDDEAGTPLVFTFPAHDGRQDYHFIPNTFQPGPQDASLFALPDGCENKLCKPSK